MRSLSSLVCALFLGIASWAQPDSSLTPEFAGLSAKERARLAKKEVEAAAQDARFQEVMAEAESYFKQQRYDESIASFRQARSLRPLNVYPKVKIQDLQALIAKRDAAAQERSAQEMEEAERAVVSPEARSASGVIQEDAEAQAGTAAPLKPIAPMRADQVKRREPEVARKTASPPPDQEVKRPDGMEERSFVEGRAMVLERRVVRGGVESVYRKVSHPWGQVVHFRDGVAISERQWADAFETQ
jgi:hypothetical protein